MNSILVRNNRTQSVDRRKQDITHFLDSIIQEHHEKRKMKPFYRSLETGEWPAIGLAILVAAACSWAIYRVFFEAGQMITQKPPHSIHAGDMARYQWVGFHRVDSPGIAHI